MLVFFWCLQQDLNNQLKTSLVNQVVKTVGTSMAIDQHKPAQRKVHAGLCCSFKQETLQKTYCIIMIGYDVSNAPELNRWYNCTFLLSNTIQTYFNYIYKKYKIWKNGPKIYLPNIFWNLLYLHKYTFYHLVFTFFEYF